MRTSVHSWSFHRRFQDPSFTIRDFLNLVADMGFTGVELLTGKAGGNTGHLRSDDPHEIEAIVRYARERNLTVDSFSTYNDFAFVANEEWRRQNITYIKHWLKLAGDLGIANIRMLTGYYIRGHSQVRLQRLIVDGIRECAVIAEQSKVNMALENHSSIFLEAEDILWLMGEIGSSRLTTCPDPTNWSKAFLDGSADSNERELVFSGVELLAPKATQSHLKIGGITEQEELIGFGTQGLERILGSYHRAGYRGALAFEHVGSNEPESDLPRAKAIVETALARFVSASPPVTSRTTTTLAPGT